VNGDIGHAFVTARAARPRGLAFRPIVDDDLPFLREVYAQSRAEEMAQVPWPDDEKRSFLDRQFALQHAFYQKHYGDSDFLIVLRDDTPIGRVYVQRVPGEMRLVDISLLIAERRRGLGRAMLRELVDEADARGAIITLHVEAQNPAQILYRELGFEMIEDRGVYQFMRREPRSRENTQTDRPDPR
jgi:ribosomal protein S18 acetylase RimI-like enzyme